MNAVAVIDSGGANLGSVLYALARLRAPAAVTCDPAQIRAAPRVILPGVGAAAPAMARLHKLGLVETIRNLAQPVLGICLGMQLLYEGSDEGDVECLGLLPGRVRRMQDAAGIRVPHMGWNALRPRRASPLLDGVPAGAHVYFVHSFAARDDDACVAACEHGQSFAAVVQRDNVCGMQFHPERSASTGARLLANFLT